MAVDAENVQRTVARDQGDFVSTTIPYEALPDDPVLGVLNGEPPGAPVASPAMR